MRTDGSPTAARQAFARHGAEGLAAEVHVGAGIKHIFPVDDDVADDPVFGPFGAADGGSGQREADEEEMTHRGRDFSATGETAGRYIAM